MVVCDAIGDPEVGRAWEKPSVLEDQLVGGLAGEGSLARYRSGSVARWKPYRQTLALNIPGQNDETPPEAAAVTRRRDTRGMDVIERATAEGFELDERVASAAGNVACSFWYATPRGLRFVWLFSEAVGNVVTCLEGLDVLNEWESAE